MASHLQYRAYDPGGRVYSHECQPGFHGNVPRSDPAGSDPGRCCSVFQKAVAFLLSPKWLGKKRHMDALVQGTDSRIAAAIIGLPFDDQIDAVFYNYQTVAVTLILYGVLFIVVENYNKKRRPRVNSFAELSWSMALFIGVFQVLALIPGTSRSGATILGAMLLGTSRYIAAEFSFFLAIPVMFGASLLKLVKFGFSFTSMELAILATGMISAFVVSILAIKFLMGYIKKNDFKSFGYYRIVLGVLVLAYFILTK